jgi:hypothetical protein
VTHSLRAFDILDDGWPCSAKREILTFFGSGRIWFWDHSKPGLYGDDWDSAVPRQSGVRKGLNSTDKIQTKRDCVKPGLHEQVGPGAAGQAGGGGPGGVFLDS